MAAPTKAKLATVRGFLTRADRRINGAAKAATRPGTDPGEFDNNFDGVVTAILHVVDAYELATTGIKRRVGEAEQATRIESVLAAYGLLKRTPTGKALHDDGSSKGLAPEDVPDEPDEVLFETIRRFKRMEREVVVLVEIPTEGDRLDELLYVGLTRATTELVVIAPPEIARRLG